MTDDDKMAACAPFKYVNYHPSHRAIFVRVPLDRERCTMRRISTLAPFDDQLDAAIRLRDRLGQERWGPHWSRMLTTERLPLPKTRSRGAYAEAGVYHSERTYTTQGGESRSMTAWIASWTEPDPKQPGKRRTRRRSFGYGSPRSQYTTSNKAYAAALALRQKRLTDRFFFNEGDTP